MTRNTKLQENTKKKPLYKVLTKGPQKVPRDPSPHRLAQLYILCSFRAVDRGQDPQEAEIILENHFLVFVLVRLQSPPRLWAAPG